ncbi:MAG: hypothetical protein VKK80_11060, partial [Prochlorothrix sp.]|nr:hypothetical protein [Prochlorothrix sp.]
MAQFSPASPPIVPGSSPATAPSLAQWFYRALGRTDWSIKTQQRGNTLHLMVEAEENPAAQAVLQPLVEILQEQALAEILPAHQAPVYVIMLYGRVLGQKKPRWKTPLYLNQLPHYQALLERQRALQQELAQQFGHPPAPQPPDLPQSPDQDLGDPSPDPIEADRSSPLPPAPQPDSPVLAEEAAEHFDPNQLPVSSVLDGLELDLHPGPPAIEDLSPDRPPAAHNGTLPDSLWLAPPGGAVQGGGWDSPDLRPVSDLRPIVDPRPDPRPDPNLDRAPDP